MKWTELAPMRQKRGEHSASVLSGKLFVTGGYGGSRLTDVEYYDPQLNKWTTVSPMNVRRDAHRCVVADNILYAIGGSNGSYLNSIEKYDEVADKWTLVIKALIFFKPK